MTCDSWVERWTNKIEILLQYKMEYMRDDDYEMTTTTDYWTATATAVTCVSVFPEKHVPGSKLTEEERDKICEQHQFGICCDCDAGLDDRSDFVMCQRDHGGYALMCNKCSEYYGV